MNDTMLHLIAYDIPQELPRIRNKLHKLLGRYGTWTQFSLFECFLTKKQSVKLIDEIKTLLKQETGHVRIYVLSKDDVERTITLGGTPPHEPNTYIF
ncbi:MAG: hypothetical protein BroJett018_32780 [Chloroflexota bacterium]|nr:CRISPR-associated endonuclease Cas2 [Chloroflexota bacterium]NOG62323.1 CRISPR-associated endonuclease Cas2 [Chloroflexota bacterium]GIK65484.1 MAG: hypothetical protein BroJett018_32780 [Chloroflexota bacterium]